MRTFAGRNFQAEVPRPWGRIMLFIWRSIRKPSELEAVTENGDSSRGELRQVMGPDPWRVLQALVKPLAFPLSEGRRHWKVLSKGNTLSSFDFQKDHFGCYFRTAMVQGLGEEARLKAGRPDRGCSEFQGPAKGALSHAWWKAIRIWISCKDPSFYLPLIYWL